MIGGVGDGTFALFMAVLVGVLLCLVGYCVAPSAVFGFVLFLVVLPFIVYGFILSAPKTDENTAALDRAAQPLYHYRERSMLPSEERAYDTYLPVRVVIVLLMGLGLLGGVGMHVVLTLTEPPYKVPRMRCLREQLEEAHPTWYK